MHRLIIIVTILLCGCSFYVPSGGRAVVEIQSDESYYAGFFRACEMLISKQVEGVYIQVDSKFDTAELDHTDQCLHMVQQMMDVNAARHYSRNWPGMLPLVLSEYREAPAVWEQPPH